MDPTCDPLEKWVAAFDINTNAPKPSISLPPAPAPLPPPPPAIVTEIPTLKVLKDQAPTIHLQFFEALQRDLCSGVARVRLYLEDEKTVRVLLEHVVEHVSQAYERRGEVMMPVQGTGGGGGGGGGGGFGSHQGDLEILSSSRLRGVERCVGG